jgi:Xaa-Pro aminopeptidase
MPGEIIERIWDLLAERQVDALVVSSLSNVTYVAGYEVPSQIFPILERLIFCIVTADGGEVMLVPDMEASMARSDSRLADVRDYNEFTDSPTEVLAGTLAELGVDRGQVAIEDDFIGGSHLDELYSLLPNTGFQAASPLMAELRLIKSPDEIEVLTRVNQIAERAHFYVAEKACEGMTELQVAQLIYESAFSEGAERVNKLVVGSGERSEHPNANPTARQLRKGDIVRTDIFLKIRGYQSDVARTAVVGTPTKEQRDIWAKLIEARALILDMIRPGASTGEIYRVYREFFERAKLKPTNFVGHGLGITLHEEPYISRYHDTELRPGMVLAIEPMHFVPGEGYQVEDEVVVTEDGYNLITDYRDPSELIVIRAN